MAKDFSREPYRKMLRNPSPSFRMLDALSQGIGYVLMREAGDDGYLPFAEDFDEGIKRLAKLVTIPPRQRTVIARCVRDLIADGCVVRVGDRLFVKSLPDINRRRDDHPKGSSKGAQTVTSEPSTDREPTTGGTSADHRLTTGEPPAALERTTGGPLADHRRTIETDPSARNHSAETASRARDQVGSKVGRKEDQEARRARPADPTHPVAEILTANDWMVLPNDPLVVAGGFIAAAKLAKRTEDDLLEAVERGLQILARKYGAQGVEDGASYLAKVVGSLLEKGGLEEVRAREPASGARAVVAGDIDDEASSRASMLRDLQGRRAG